VLLLEPVEVQRQERVAVRVPEREPLPVLPCPSFAAGHRFAGIP